MIRTIQPNIVRDDLRMDTDVTFFQAPAFGGLVTQDLKLTVVYHRSPDMVFNEENGGKAGPCDVWDRADGPALPAIIWLCGGGWILTNRNNYLPNLLPLAHRGYVLVTADYQGSNEARFPSQLVQIKAAIRYLRANARKYHIDPNAIGIMGESAGGYYSHLAGVTGETREFDVGPYLEYSSAVQAACPWYGPAECSLDEPCGVKYHSYLKLDGRTTLESELAHRANPMTYITEKTPPFLLLHGEADMAVPPRRSEEMYEALIAKGVDATLVHIPGAGHADIHFFQPEVMDCIGDFFDRVLKGKTAPADTARE